MQGAFEWLNGEPGAGARGCFTQASPGTRPSAAPSAAHIVTLSE